MELKVHRKHMIWPKIQSCLELPPFDSWLRLNKQANLAIYSGVLKDRTQRLPTRAPSNDSGRKGQQVTTSTVLKMFLLLTHGWPLYPNYKSMMPGLSSPCARNTLIDSHDWYEFLPHSRKCMEDHNIVISICYLVMIYPCPAYLAHVVAVCCCFPQMHPPTPNQVSRI